MASVEYPTLESRSVGVLLASISGDILGAAPEARKMTSQDIADCWGVLRDFVVRAYTITCT
jgi:hypothetical protein